jgi:hypothetical protein
LKSITFNNLSWFVTEKTETILAKEITGSKTIQTLEGPIQALIGDYLCKGIKDEQWAIKKEDLKRCYKPTGKSEGDWKEYEPDSSNCHLWAAELIEEVKIDTQFGKLKGCKGDFILKETEKDSEIPLRYWIVNNEIFKKTYKKL